MNLFSKKILSLDPEIFGVDLSDLSVKVMQLESDGKHGRVKSYATAEIPLGCIDDGKIINKERVADIIKQVVKKAEPEKLSSNKVICSLPESKAFLRIISIPRMEESEAESAIKWEMEANIPLPIDQVYFDWQFLETENKHKQNVLTVAISKNIVEDLIEVLNKAGLDVYGLEIESIASARSLMDEKVPNKGVNLIVDMGAQHTSFIMITDGIPCFTSSIPFSSESINDAIMKSMNLTMLEAEKIKINHGIENNMSNPVFEVIKPLLENLVQEIDRTIDFFGEMDKERPKVEKIILCGGGSNMRGLVAYLAKRLGYEVELGDPWVNLNIGNDLPIINKKDSVRYSTVIGLALRGLDYENQA